MSRKRNSRNEQNFNLPLESYSPWSPCIIKYGLKLRNEMFDHSIYIVTKWILFVQAKIQNGCEEVHAQIVGEAYE